VFLDDGPATVAQSIGNFDHPRKIWLMRGVFRRILLVGVASSLLLPVAMSVVFGLGTLLDSLGDETGGAVCGRVALGLAALWLTAVIATAVASGVSALDQPSARSSRRLDDEPGRGPGDAD
jgi:hypothetical protein